LPSIPIQRPQVFSKKFIFILALTVVASVIFNHFNQSPSDSEKFPSNKQEFLPNLKALPKQVVLIGLDGVNWSSLVPLLNKGKLPMIASLMEQGTYGHLSTLKPTISPAIWTSVVTGQLPEKHGITDFTMTTEKGEKIPANRMARKSNTLWNILSHFEAKVGIVNWWSSWPAEPVNGFLISDFAAMGRRKEQAKDLGLERLEDTNEPYSFYPEEEMLKLEKSVSISEVSKNDLAPFAELTASDQNNLSFINSWERGNPLSVLKFCFMSDQYYSALTLRSLEEMGLPDLLCYYTKSTDALAHTLWKYSYPEGYPPYDSTLQQTYKNTLDAYLIGLDEQIGKILSLYPPEVNVILMSDHGMIGMPDVTSLNRQQISARHTDHALIILKGVDFKSDQLFHTQKIEGEHFERWNKSLNYQESGYRNLFPGGWMETEWVTSEGDFELQVDWEIENDLNGQLVIYWDSEKRGVLSDQTFFNLQSSAGLHRLRLEYQPGSNPAGTPLHPKKLPITLTSLNHSAPIPFSPGKDWGYSLYMEGEFWVISWSAYQGHLFEVNPVFSGNISCLEGFIRMDAPSSDEIQLKQVENFYQFTHQMKSSGSGSFRFIPQGPVTLDLKIDGERYPRMVYLNPFSRIKVDRVTLKISESEIKQPSILDITPTLLNLFGLPVAKDMDGRIWDEYLVERNEIKQIESYQALPVYQELSEEYNLKNEDQLNYLKTMGYLGDSVKAINLSSSQRPTISD